MVFDTLLPLVLGLALVFLRAPLPRLLVPGIESAGVDLEDPAHRVDPERFTVALNKTVLHPDSESPQSS